MWRNSAGTLHATLCSTTTIRHRVRSALLQSGMRRREDHYPVLFSHMYAHTIIRPIAIEVLSCFLLCSMIVLEDNFFLKTSVSLTHTNLGLQTIGLCKRQGNKSGAQHRLSESVKQHQQYHDKQTTLVAHSWHSVRRHPGSSQKLNEHTMIGRE